MLTKITSVQDVEAFAKQLIAEGVSFHPDDDFEDYVYFRENRPCYTKEEAAIRNQLMQQCFEVCENENVDICVIMLEVTLKETGMDIYIPLPSAPFQKNQ